MRLLFEKYEEYRQRGLDEYKRGEFPSARYDLLKAAEYLFTISSRSSGKLKESRKENALKLLEMAKKIKGKEAARKVLYEQGEPSGGEGRAQKWIVTQKPKITLSDVAGLDDVKDAIKVQIIYPFRYPEVVKKYNLKAGGGILLYGPPGTGKTMIAKAIANEIDAVFFSVSGSDIMNKWVGESEKNLRALFEEARRHPRSIVFFDEAERIIAKRGSSSTVQERVIAEFLTLVDGIGSETENTLLVLAATNTPWAVDEAALRPGRFDKLIYVGPPDEEARRKILDDLLNTVPVSPDLNISTLAERFRGYSGADIKGIVKQASEIAAQREVEEKRDSRVELTDIEQVMQKVQRSITEETLHRFKTFEKKRKD